ncbi:MAG: hypothetical protein IIA17_01190 [candidate division Zixibacteria bacterium]|nr:hypothetical protein [candidate division Zixibacteria bacterium]
MSLSANIERLCSNSAQYNRKIAGVKIAVLIPVIVVQKLRSIIVHSPDCV